MKPAGTGSVGLVQPAGLAIMLIAANAAFTVHLWLPAERAVRALIPGTAITVYASLLIAVTLVAGRQSRSSVRQSVLRRVILSLATIWAAFHVVYSGAESLFLYIYGRSFIPAADIPMVRGALLLLFGEIGPLVEILTPIVIALIAGAALGVSVVWGLGIVALLRPMTNSWLGLSSHTDQPPSQPRRKSVLGICIALGLIPLTAQAISAPEELLPIRALHALRTPETLFRRIEGLQSVGAEDKAQTEPENVDTGDINTSDLEVVYTFPGLRDRDIHNIVVESYGYAVFSRPDLHEMYRPIHEEFENALAEAGFQAVSGYLLAPVAGGFSWLAEATFMTGQLVNSQPAFLRLIEHDLPSVSSVLRDGGYYTLMVRPGTVHGRWNQEADFYGFVDTMIPYDGDFAYAGPGFSFVPITDQFALWRAHQRLEEQRRPGGAAEGRPVYAHYQLVSSHTPFNRIPPYIEDWEKLGDGSIYRELEILRFDNDWGRGNELDEGYIASLDYVMTVVHEYITRFLPPDDNSLILIWGDHQPQRPIREADAHLSVPLHVISRDPKLLEPWLEHGLQPGFIPRQEPPHPHMKEFFPMFLDVVGQGSARPRHD